MAAIQVQSTLKRRQAPVFQFNQPRSTRSVMLIPCSRVQAMMADPGIRLDRHTPDCMVWDEHGGTYVLRVNDLTATEVAADASETGIILEIPLSGPEALIRSLEEFAASNSSHWPRPRARNCWRRPSWRPVTCRGRTCSSLRRAAPGGQKARGGRGTGGGRPFQDPAGPLQGNRPGHSPHQGRHGPAGCLGGASLARGGR